MRHLLPFLLACLAASGAEGVAPLTPERLLPAMQQALHQARGDVAADIEIVEMSRFPMPEGEVEFLLKDLTQPSPANAPTRWRGSVRTGDDRTLSIWAIVRVSAPCSRVVATEALSVGRPILETQVREEKYQGFPFGNNCSITLADVVGRAPIRTLRSGSAIAPESTVEPIVISSGDGIVAEFRSSRVRVTAEVVALGSGRIGDSISVRNPSSKKIFSATVSGAGHVVVEDIQ